MTSQRWQQIEQLYHSALEVAVKVEALRQNTTLP